MHVWALAHGKYFDSGVDENSDRSGDIRTRLTISFKDCQTYQPQFTLLTRLSDRREKVNYRFDSNLPRQCEAASKRASKRARMHLCWIVSDGISLLIVKWQWRAAMIQAWPPVQLLLYSLWPCKLLHSLTDRTGSGCWSREECYPWTCLLSHCEID